MRYKAFAAILAAACLTLLAGCKQAAPLEPVVDTGPGDTMQVNTIDYSAAPPAQRWYGNQGNLTSPLLESDISGENPFYTESEIKNLEHHSNIRILYDGHGKLSFSALEGDCSLYTDESGENPYLDAAPFITEVAFDDTVKTLGSFTLRDIPNPITISVTPSLSGAVEPFTARNTMVAGFTLTGESDTVKVIGNGLYVYSPDREGWELLKYATANMATGFVLPSEIHVVYIHKFAFAGNQYLKDVDLSSSKDLTMGFGAFADTNISRVVVHEEYNPDILYRNAGHTFDIYQIGNKSFTAADLGYAAVATAPQ